MNSIVHKIAPDLSNLTTVLNEYDAWMKGYEKNIKVDMKTYAKANSEQAGLLAYYSEMHNELEIMHKDMEMRTKVARANAMNKVHKRSDRNYTETQLKIIIDADPDVTAMATAAREIEERQKKSETIVNALHQRGFTLNNMTRIRIGGFQDEYMYVNED